MIKRWISLFLVLCCFLSAAVSCGKKEATDKLQIVCTVFPLYDWAKNIVGESDSVEVSLLVTNGADLHSYQPSAQDMMKIASADLFFYVGGVSDAWIEDALSAHSSEHRIDVKMTEIPQIRLREICADSTLEHHDHEHGAKDEHLWLSLENAKTAASYLCDQLCALNEAESSEYRENLTQYTAALSELDEAYAALVASVDDPMMLCADRFPFVYLAEDYGIRYIAAFEGCSTDANASPDTILRLAKALDDHALPALIVTERSDLRLAESVRAASREKNQTILRLDSMQSVTRNEIDGGADYLNIMEKNLETLRQLWQA